MKILMVPFLMLLTMGCATQTFVIQGGPMGSPNEEEMHLFWVGGIGQGDVVNAAKICGGSHNVARVVAYRDTLDNVYAWASLGVFTPATAQVYCLR